MAKNQTEKIVLLIHQSSDLYGSDKTLLSLAIAIQNMSEFKPIVVVPAHGPLVEKLRQEGIEVMIMSVIKVSRSLLSIKNVWRLPWVIRNETQIFKNKFKEKEIAIIHSNTLAVLMGMLVYKDLKTKHIWHIHEIIEKPTWIAQLYRYILPLRSDIILTNSMATYQYWMNNRTTLSSKFRMVYNGIQSNVVNKDDLNLDVKTKIFNLPQDSIVIGLVGRINAYKGQQLLLQAFENFFQKYPKTYLVFIGSAVSGQEYYLNTLQQAIDASPAKQRCRLLGFQENIHAIWKAIDIAVVPTLILESFGLVALEAMLAKKPVIASAAGGLMEVVEDEKSGLLFQPNNVSDLENKLETLVANKALREQMGEFGYRRAISTFSLNQYTNSILNIYKQLIA